MVFFIGSRDLYFPKSIFFTGRNIKILILGNIISNFIYTNGYLELD